jgi:hypothetical protein
LEVLRASLQDWLLPRLSLRFQPLLLGG